MYHWKSFNWIVSKKYYLDDQDLIPKILKDLEDQERKLLPNNKHILIRRYLHPEIQDAFGMKNLTRAICDIPHFNEVYISESILALPKRLINEKGLSNE